MPGRGRVVPGDARRDPAAGPRPPTQQRRHHLNRHDVVTLAALAQKGGGRCPRSGATRDDRPAGMAGQWRVRRRPPLGGPEPPDGGAVPQRRGRLVRDKGHLTAASDAAERSGGRAHRPVVGWRSSGTEEDTMSYFSKRALRWAAPVALVGALGLAACGNSDDTEAVRVAAPSAVGVGSDQHLNNKAAEIAKASLGVGSDQHLNNKAAEIASQRANRAASDRLTGQAEQIQRAEVASQRANRAASDRLTGQAEQIQRAEAASNSSGNDPYGGEFLPGSRHMPVR